MAYKNHFSKFELTKKLVHVKVELITVYHVQNVE